MFINVFNTVVVMSVLRKAGAQLNRQGLQIKKKMLMGFLRRTECGCVLSIKVFRFALLSLHKTLKKYGRNKYIYLKIPCFHALKKITWLHQLKYILKSNGFAQRNDLSWSAQSFSFCLMVPDKNNVAKVWFLV